MSGLNAHIRDGEAALARHAQDVVSGYQSWREDIHDRWVAWMEKRAATANQADAAVLLETVRKVRAGEARLPDPVELEIVLRSAGG